MPLHVAVIRQHYHVVQALFAAGADVRARDATANTVLHFAAEHGGTEEVVQQLIAAGADLAARDRAGATPLLVAVDGRQLGVAQVLLTAGACANTPSHSGLPPLQLAVGRDNVQLVRMLLRAGANPNCHMPQLPSGVNALSLAVIKAGCEVVSALLNAGAEIAGPNDEYDAIEAAFETKKFEMIPLLLTHPRSRLSVPMLQEGLWQALMESEPVGPMYDLVAQLQLHLYKVQRQQELQAQLSVQALALPVAEVLPPQELIGDVLASEGVVERRISRSALSLALLQGWAADTAAVDAAGALLAGGERGGAAVAAAAREVLMQHAATRRAAACRAAL